MNTFQTTTILLLVALYSSPSPILDALHREHRISQLADTAVGIAEAIRWNNRSFRNNADKNGTENALSKTLDLYFVKIAGFCSIQGSGSPGYLFHRISVSGLVSPSPDDARAPPFFIQTDPS